MRYAMIAIMSGLLLWGCSGTDKPEGAGAVAADTPATAQQPPATPSGAQDQYARMAPAVLLEKLQGVWAPSPEENASFNIEGNTMTYMEDPERHMPIEVKGGYLQWHYRESGGKYKILTLEGDSLVLQDEQGNESRFVRIEH